MKNYNDIIQTLIDVNDKLIKGEIDIEKAKVIGQNTQTLINAAKVQLEYARQSKNEAKFFIEATSNPFDELKKIAQKAVELNNSENFDEVTDKRPFDFTPF